MNGNWTFKGKVADENDKWAIDGDVFEHNGQLYMIWSGWEGDKNGQQDIYIAKNYLTEDEIDYLNRFVTVFLETAELRAKNRQDITMSFWKENIDKIILLNDKPILKTKGKVSHPQMEQRVDAIFETFDAKRKIADAKEADKHDLEELKALENKIKKAKK